MRKYDRCIELCEQGLRLEPDNRELKDISQRAAVEKDAQVQRDDAEQQRQARIRSPARQLASTVLARGWRVGRPQFTIGESANVPVCGCWCDRDSILDQWPVLELLPCLASHCR